jgi:peptide/nickel transport system permease protein
MWAMHRYIIRRVLLLIPNLIGISLISFFIINMAPGDPIDAMINPDMRYALGPEWEKLERERLGLNQPVAVRYVLWLKEAVRGNLGFSYYDRRPVLERIGERLGPTLRLMASALAVSLIIGVSVGILSALKPYSLIDYFATFFTYTAISIPDFFFAMGLIYIFAVKLKWLPTSGMLTPGLPPSILDQVSHLILPASMLGLALAAAYVRYTRASMLEVIHQDYVTTARAKGLSEGVVIIRHVFRNALLPVVTLTGLRIPLLFGGAIIAETLFAWPGMGKLGVEAVAQRDYPVLMGINFVGAILVLLSNLLTDLTYAWIDPRIRYE